MCYLCMQLLANHNANSNVVHCPVCRALIPCESVSYIYGGGTTNIETTGVVGNYSMKILAVTAKVLDLVKADAHVKVLVFSTVIIMRLLKCVRFSRKRTFLLHNCAPVKF